MKQHFYEPETYEPWDDLTEPFGHIYGFIVTRGAYRQALANLARARKNNGPFTDAQVWDYVYAVVINNLTMQEVMNGTISLTFYKDDFLMTITTYGIQELKRLAPLKRNQFDEERYSLLNMHYEMSLKYKYDPVDLTKVPNH